MRISRKKVDNFWLKRTQVPNPRVATHFKVDAALSYDLQLIRKYLTKDSEVLDMGCGTCAISNEIISEVKSIMAVDKFGAFLQYCNTTTNLKTHAEDILTYKDDNTYDVILVFGVLNYFNPSEIAKILTNLSGMLKPHGVLLIKHSCGVHEDVNIDKYSQEIGDNYHAIYRSIEKEKTLFSAHLLLEKVVDIYPAALNRWENTHFYAFVCRKKK